MRPPRLVQYSLFEPPHHPRPDLLGQLAASLSTLREHNARIPVVLFLHGNARNATSELTAICNEHDVVLHEQGPYDQRLARLCPNGWPALARYPLLHKLMNFRELDATSLAQILCCDCDTLFFRDVEELFDRYCGADVVAREEVFSSRSSAGPETSFIDEPLLARIASTEGATPIPPFNVGVVLLNNGVWRAIAALERVFIDYVWRFVTWMAQHPATGAAALYGDFDGVEAAARIASPADRARALPFPSINRWIVDEVAIWLTLGHVHGVRTADFRAADVVQDGEFGRSDPRSARWVACHYFTQNAGLIDAWLRGEQTNEERLPVR